MGRIFGRLFLDHPRSVGESYLEHHAFALGFAMRLFGAAFAALIHSILPFMFETTASRTVKQIARELETRGAAPNAAE